MPTEGKGNPEQYIPLEQLREEERAKVLELEAKTDEVYRLRTQLADFYRTNGGYLDNGRQGINWKKVDQEIDARSATPEEKSKKKRWSHLVLENKLNRALALRKELQGKGGDFKTPGGTFEQQEIKD